MPPDEPRRFLFAVGIGEYKSDRWQNIDKVADEMRAMVELLSSERFGYENIAVEKDLPQGKEGLLRALSEWSKKARRSDHLVFYWTGHGEALSGKLYLVLPDTTDVLVDGLAVEEIFNILLGPDSRAGPVLLLLDVCYAGQGAIDLGSRLGPLILSRTLDKPFSIDVICASHSRDVAFEFVFANAFVQAVTDAVDPYKRLPPVLGLSDIVNRMNAASRTPATFPYFSSGYSQSLFLRNPHHIAHWPSGIDAATEAVLAKLDVRARGIASLESDGWFFKGRKRVFADLCAWLRNEATSGMCMVSGGLGAGKSAVLARLYTLNFKEYRQHVPPEALAETELAPVESIDGIILLSKMFPSEVIKEIAGKLGAVARTADGIVEELEKLGRTAVLLADQLDEAVMPVETRALLETISEKNVKVIVGARSPCMPVAGRTDIEINLDTAPWADPDAVKDYVRQRLASELRDDDAPGRFRQDDLACAVSRVVERAQGNFLMASLLVTAMISRPADAASDSNWILPESVRDAFAQIFESLREDEPVVRDLLLPLAYAEGNGLPKGELWAALATRFSRQEISPSRIDVVFRRAPWFMVEDLYDGRSVYRLFHIALVDYLQEGKPPEPVHAQIALTLRQYLKPPNLEGAGATDDIVYARRYLAVHLRRANEWRELGRLVTDPAWIAGKSSRLVPFENEDLASDMEDAQQAARDANSRAASEDRPLPALAESVWGLLWRCRHVTLCVKIPPAVWPVLIQLREMTPVHALRLLASVANETLVASRLATLARVFQRDDLDRLLDFAEGFDVFPASPATASSTGEPMKLYETILAIALAGADGPRLTRRALATAARGSDYQRWLVLDAVMPHLDPEQLCVALELIGDIGKNNDRIWQVRSYSAYIAECAQRGNEHAVRQAVENLHQESLAWWFSTAALFALKKAGQRTILGGLRLTTAIFRAERSIDDWYYRLLVMTALVRSLRRVRSGKQRAALAAYLRCLHRCTTVNAVVTQAALAGECLPQPHGIRLLRWAKAKFSLAQATYDANLNLYFTPAALARAFASTGDLTSALSVVTQTGAHDFLRPQAFEAVAQSFKPRRQKSGRVFFDFSSLLQPDLSPEMRLQLMCARFDSLNDADRRAVNELLGANRIEFGDDVRLARCYVLAERARHASAGEIDALYQQMPCLPPPSPVLRRFAVNCAAAGHVQIVPQIIDTIESYNQVDAWTEALCAASEPCAMILFQTLASRPHHVEEMLKYDRTCCAFFEFVRRVSSISIRTLGAAASTDQHSHTEFRLVVAVRAFELDLPDLAESLLENYKVSPSSLLEVRRLDPVKRHRLITLINATCQVYQQQAVLVDLVARLLSVNERDAEAISDQILDILSAEVRAEKMFYAKLLAGVLNEQAVRKLATVAFDTQIDKVALYAATFSFSFSWILPWLEAQQLDQLLDGVRKFRDDHHRNEALILILPHFAARHTWMEAMALRSEVTRNDFEAASWAAIWNTLPDEEKSSAFLNLIPQKVWPDGGEARALGKLAPVLADGDFIRAIRWMVQHHRGDNADLLAPLVQQACLRSRKFGLLAWETIATEAARSPGDDAMAFLSVSLPLLERLGGPESLVGIDELLHRAITQRSHAD